MEKTTAAHRRHPIIQLSNVIKKFHLAKQETEILHGINVAIFPHEFTMIYGPSGSGKSTLLNTIIGLERVSNGKVVVHGTDISTLDDDNRAVFRNHRIGVVYQQPYWIKTLTVLDNVALPLLFGRNDLKAAHKKAFEMLSHVGMENFAKNSPMTLSGGQQQKVSIARSLICDPALIVADEPTGNLDSISANDIIQLFIWLIKDFHKSVVMVTHELDFLRFADRAISIHDGYIESVLDKEELKNVVSQMKGLPTG